VVRTANEQRTVSLSGWGLLHGYGYVKKVHSFVVRYEGLILACRNDRHSVLGRESGAGPEKIESPMQGIAKDGPDETDESFAVRGIDEVAEFMPKR